jgi:hypothetical protein
MYHICNIVASIGGRALFDSSSGFWFNGGVRNILLSFTFLFIWSCGTAQTSTPKEELTTPSPTEPKLEKLTVIDANTLKNLPSAKESFQSDEDGFRIRLPRSGVSYSPSGFPKAGERPVAGHGAWKMQEAEIDIQVSPIPPGLIATWSKERLADELKQTVERSVGNVTGGKKLYDREITQGELLGREIKVHAQRIDLIARMFYANDRLYLLGAMLTDEKDAEDLAKKALDTFEVVKK